MTYPTIHVICLPQRKELIEKEFAKYNITDYKLWPAIVDRMVPMRGINLSHKAIVIWAKTENLSEVLIAEDDMVFTANGAFEYFLENKPEDYDLYLSSVYCGKIETDNTCKDFRGLTLYFISSRFYDTFLSTPEKQNIDSAMFRLGKYVVCQPFIALQREGYSYHLKMMTTYGHYLFRRPIFGYKNYKEYEAKNKNKNK